MATIESNGTVEEKSEHLKKDGSKFWKFKIDGRTLSLWDYDAGVKIGVGDQVNYEFTEKQGDYQGKPITYRNLTKIVNANIVEEVIGDDSNSKHEEQIKKQPDGLAKNALNKTHADIIKKGVPANLQQQATQWNNSNDIQARIMMGQAFNNAATLIAPLMVQGLEVDSTGAVKTGWTETWEKVYVSLSKRLFQIYKEMQSANIGDNK